jgi:hypothetical protein
MSVTCLSSTNFTYTCRFVPSICIIVSVFSSICSCSYSHSYISKADILGLFRSNVQIIICLCSVKFYDMLPGLHFIKRCTVVEPPSQYFAFVHCTRSLLLSQARPFTVRSTDQLNSQSKQPRCCRPTP